MVIRRVHVGANTQQQRDGLTVIPVSGPDQSRRAVGSTRVDVDAMACKQAS